MRSEWKREALLERLAGRTACGDLFLPDLMLWHA